AWRLGPRPRPTLFPYTTLFRSGVVPGSLTLIGGDPGIGKSTLMLQISHHVAQKHGPVLYISGEESFDQTRLRARRLGTVSDGLLDRKSTRLNSSHVKTSYAVFC